MMQNPQRVWDSWSQPCSAASPGWSSVEVGLCLLDRDTGVSEDAVCREGFSLAGAQGFGENPRSCPAPGEILHPLPLPGSWVLLSGIHPLLSKGFWGSAARGGIFNLS